MNGNVSLCTDEKELEVIFGKYAPRGKEEDVCVSFKYICSDLRDIRQSYIRLGFHLDEFSRFGYYFDFGYGDFYEFCEVNFGLDKSAVSRCISVYKIFNALHDIIYNANLKTRGAAIELSDKYRDYNYSQLCESVKYPVVVHIYGNKGKKLFAARLCDVLMDTDTQLVIRLKSAGFPDMDAEK